MTELYNDPNYTELRRELRARSTLAESLLWERIRNRQVSGIKFHRQYGVLEYILDFYCPKSRLAIELDGGYHEENLVKLADEFRTRDLNDLNILVIRFKNDEVIYDMDRVISEIEEVVSSRVNSPPAPSLKINRGGSNKTVI